jgi:hypothetical protein
VAGRRRRRPCGGRLWTRIRRVGKRIVTLQKNWLSGIAIDGDEVIVEKSWLRTVEVDNAVRSDRGRQEKLEDLGVEGLVRSIYTQVVIPCHEESVPACHVKPLVEVTDGSKEKNIIPGIIIFSL